MTGGKRRSRNVTFSGIKGNNCHASFPSVVRGWWGGCPATSLTSAPPPVLTGRGEDTEQARLQEASLRDPGRE